jgi:hypothetical protein
MKETILIAIQSATGKEFKTLQDALNEYAEQDIIEMWLQWENINIPKSELRRFISVIKELEKGGKICNGRKM